MPVQRGRVPEPQLALGADQRLAVLAARVSVQQRQRTGRERALGAWRQRRRGQRDRGSGGDTVGVVQMSGEAHSGGGRVSRPDID